MIYSSTILKLFTNNCPGALQKNLDGEPYDREHFQAGVAAHAILEEITKKKATEFNDQLTVADAVVEELIQKGRSYNRIPEPPMNPELALAGRDIVIGYLMYSDLPDPDSIVSVEGGYGMTASGAACGYYEECVRYRAIIDLIYRQTVGDEDYAVDALVVRDYKSAWPTGEEELETLQRKGQAVLAYKRHCTGANAEEYAIIRQEVVNLRTGASFTNDINLDDEGIEMLMRWEKDILMVCNAADATRQYRPGAGCLSCNYTLSCDACLHAYKGDGVTQAVQYAAIEAIRADLGKVLKEKTKESPIGVPGGSVGYERYVSMVPVENANQLMTEHWFMDGDIDENAVSGLLKAMKMTKANIENALKTIYQGRDGKAQRDAILEDLLEDKPMSRFKVYKQ